MKNYILKSIMLTLFVSLFSSCSENDDQEPFEPVTINLVGVGVELDDTTFTQQGFNFTIYQAISDEGNGDNGILLAYPDSQSNPSTLTLDLNGIIGISKIIVEMLDNCGTCTSLTVLNNGSTVLEQSGGTGQRTVELNVEGQSIDALRIASFEAIIQSIRLE